MIWGDDKLNITLNRADFWDHRGGMPFTEEMTYANIRECLEAGDEERLRKLFENTAIESGEPRRPSRLPLGRLELDFGEDSRIKTGVLNTKTGEVKITVSKDGGERSITCVLLMDKPCLYITLDDGLSIKSIIRKTSWEYVGEHLKNIDFKPPEIFDSYDKRLSGWVQARPVDPSICVGYRNKGDDLIITAVYGDTDEDAKSGAEDIVDQVLSKGFGEVSKANRSWWKSYWKDVPSVKTPSKEMNFIYRYGMYKFAGLTHPDGVAATLQGPWVEEYQMPPWSSDYHFNINVQECYWPTFAGNRLEHIKPLFDMIKSWEDKLRHNAKIFLGIDDGLMLPHAVDDRCVCMGGFWTGSIDHGSTSWVAQLMWLYYKYSMDVDFLRETAYPFMKGAMRVYEEMLEDKDGELSLPVSVSPEYNGASMNAWGKNASFQLSLIHFLCRTLCEAAEILGTEDDVQKWKDIDSRLPDMALINGRIALWEGQDLERSHRHHSHLAGIYPFDAIDYLEGDQKEIVDRSITHWVSKGMGEWSGWCIPWASIMHSRLGNGEAAEMLLKIWRKFFTNEGHGTLHDVNYPGISVMGMGRSKDKSREIMQIEAGMAAVTAVQEMLLHTAKGVTRIFPGVPDSWRSVSFKGMRTEGAFLVSARMKAGKITKVRIFSENGLSLKIQNNISEVVTVKRGSFEELISDEIIELNTSKGENITIVPKNIE
jgi:hypothetical protein